MSKEIRLPKGKITIVDDEDYELTMQYKWYANLRKDGSYRVRTTNRKKCPFLFLHQLIMNSKLIDHKDGNPLNNQKNNLRVCTRSQNSRNVKKNKNNTSGYKGVHFERENLSKPWRARIRTDSGRKNLGFYTTAEEAAHAYDEAAIKYHGEFARLNFPKT